MDACQHDGPFLGPLTARCRIILRIQKRDPNFDNHPYMYSTTRNPMVLVYKVYRRSCRIHIINSMSYPSEVSNGCFCNMRLLFLGGLTIRVLLFRVYVRALEFWKLPTNPK